MDIDHQRPTVLSKLKKALSIATVFFLLYWTLSSKSQLPFNKYPTAPVPSKSKHVSQDSSTTHPDAPQRQNTSLLAVKGTKTVMASAYLEHRTGKKQVRVITVVQRSEQVSYRCLFCCKENPLLISKGDRNIHSDHFGFAYGTADITCPLPSGCKTPTKITLTSAAANPADDLRETFLEVKNQQVKTDSFPYDFTVCISTMYDFTNVLQLVQSLEMLQLLGVNRVAIYKTSCSPETQRILDYYTHKGLVEVIPWSFPKFLKVSNFSLPSRGPGHLHYHGQIFALNECLYRYMYQSRYVALHDIDELILPRTVDSWVEMLSLLKRRNGARNCYMFEDYVFPAFPGSASNSSWKKVPGVNILDYLTHEPTGTRARTNFKIIVNPRAVFSVTIHGVLNMLSSCSWVDVNIARLHHTRAQRKAQPQDKLTKDERLLNYGENLTQAVNTVLHKTGLL